MTQQQRRRPRRGTTALLIMAGVVWLFTIAVLLSADWFLSCQRNGAHFGGMDCPGGVPQTDSAPARWIGFVPLAAAFALASIVLLIAAIRRRPRAETGS